jgi:mannose-6-phosphate isomerase-like protein (cupin superfamily)
MRRSLVLVCVVALSLVAASASAQETEQSIAAMLEHFSEDYKADPMAISANFGVKVGEEWWSVSVERKQEAYAQNERLTFHNAGPHRVVLKAGPPETATWYFEIADKSILDKFYDGTLNAGTASMQSFDSDQVALEIRSMEGYKLDAGAEALMYHTMSHFWVTGIPEIVTFGRDKTLPTHGADAAGLYNMKDKRIAWFSIGKDEAANEDPRLQFGQVPNLFIFTKGRGKADFGEGEIDVHEGMSVFAGPYVKNVISNPYDEPLEGILILYGDNPDFAFGKSYMDYVEDQYRFLSDYPFKEE